MRSNDFRVDTTPSASPSILRKRQTLLGLALLLTIPQMISAVYLPIRWALDAKAGAALNIAHLASNELYFLVMSIAGAAVLKMMLSDATFSRTLVRCTRAEGILLAAAAAVFPFLPGYTSSGSTFLFFRCGPSAARCPASDPRRTAGGSLCAADRTKRNSLRGGTWQSYYDSTASWPTGKSR